MESVRPLGNKLGSIIELIRFEHSIFALPFAMMSLFMVYGGLPDLKKTLWIVLCMICARSASMAFNRIADYSYDLKNPRTSARPLQSGRVTMREVWLFTILMSLLFVLSAAMLNRVAFILSFAVLPLLFGYSYTKRFTFLSHLILGFALGCSPVAVWIAVRESISTVSILLCIGVTFWVAGFDVFYAMQDTDFDRRERLMSIPAHFGAAAALVSALIFHLITLISFVFVGIAGTMGPVYYLGLALIFCFLFYEHLTVRKHGLSRINTAFFTVNGVVSIIFFAFSVADIFLRKT